MKHSTDIPVKLELPLSPAESTPIARNHSWMTIGDITYYFYNLEPYDFHKADDARGMHLRIARLHELNRIRIVDLVRAFPVSLSTVRRAISLMKTKGEDGFSEPQRRRGRTVIKRETAEKAEAMLASGMSRRACAIKLGVAYSTFSENLSSGIIRSPSTSGKQPASGRSQRDGHDRKTAMGRAFHDVDGRTSASNGMMIEASPAFNKQALGVSNGGVLTALPMLLEEGLLDTARQLLRLPKGFYGLSTIIVFIAFLIMARVRTSEALRYQSPGEWGIVLGLDRCPEVKTLRKKVSLICSSHEAVRGWQKALIDRWVEAEPKDWMTLAVDGHTKVYSGRKGKLPRHFVSRQKLCLAASTSYWINAMGGKPLICLHKDLDPKMVKMLEHDVVPELQAMGVVPEDAPDLARTDNCEPAVTLVFDREGWSPSLFLRLARKGIACITWHKNFSGEDWPSDDFEVYDVAVRGPAGSVIRSVRLTEKRIVLNNGPCVRQIRRLLDNGRQVPLVTTHPTMPVEEVAGAMFSRWSQENFFKYMRDEFNLDALPEHAIEDVDPDALVINPDRRKVQKRINKVKAHRDRLIVKASVDTRIDEGVKAKIVSLDEELENLKQQRGILPKHVRAGDLPRGERLNALPVPKRLFIDIIRMICYRAETKMMQAITEGQGRRQDGRKLLAALMRADADILPESDKGILRVRIPGLSNKAMDRELLVLIDELNRTRTVYPGTDLRLVYELQGAIST